MSAFIKKKNDDGTENPRYVDLLEEDKAISGQSYVCVSFVSPENTLKKRELFLFEHFLKYFDFSKSMKKFTQFINLWNPLEFCDLNLIELYQDRIQCI